MTHDWNPSFIDLWIPGPLPRNPGILIQDFFEGELEAVAGMLQLQGGETITPKPFRMSLEYFH